MYLLIGKTACIIESVFQICCNYPRKRILVCAPSDAAADVIMSRLIDSDMFQPPVKPSERKTEKDERGKTKPCLMRLNWWQRMPHYVSDAIRNYSIHMVIRITTVL